MKKGYLALAMAVLLLLPVTTASAADAGKTVEAVESDLKVLYNGIYAQEGNRPLLANGTLYLPFQSVLALLNKYAVWDKKSNMLVISDKTGAPAQTPQPPAPDSKEAVIAGLEDRIKKLEAEAAAKVPYDIKDLEAEMNEECEDYEGVSYRVMLTDGGGEKRVKILIDTKNDRSSWNRLTASKRTGLLQQICDRIQGIYSNVKIKGYVKDIDSGSKLLSFYNTPDGTAKIGTYKNFNSAAALEDDFNSDYNNSLKGMSLVYELAGSENGFNLYIYFDNGKFSREWSKITDSNLKLFLKKLCGDIDGVFGESNIYVQFTDLESGEELASYEKRAESINFNRQ